MTIYFLAKKAWFHQMCLIDIYAKMDQWSTFKPLEIAKFSTSRTHTPHSCQQLLPPEPISNPEKTLLTIFATNQSRVLYPRN